MFEQVVFAGGGHRCWWQAGFWEVAKTELELTPRLIAGVSAGAATACLVYTGNTLQALEYYDALLGSLTNRPDPRNFYWGRLFSRGQRALPHDDIYRTALSNFFDAEGFKSLMWSAPEIRVVYSTLPSWLGPRSATLVGMLAYNAEKRLYRPLHPTWGRKLGFKPMVERIQDCKGSEDLISLLIASACTPPMTRIEYRDGQATLDGGMVDNVPVHAVEPDKSTMVLLSRQYPKHAPMFSRDGHIYVQPSQKIPVSSWDYTDPQLYRDTYNLGRKDAYAFLKGFKPVELQSR
jgi:predicted acylesterase/phospholipase RssA